MVEDEDQENDKASSSNASKRGSVQNVEELAYGKGIHSIAEVIPPRKRY